MKENYKGYQLEAYRDKSENLIFVSAYRLNDGWELLTDAYDGDMTVKQAMSELKYTVEDYILHEEYCEEEIYEEETGDD